jgi:16S rRNA A1518/A1519 N6-dimethyltransferase RsmA/KsgA/DIM1 with predicted DNA glycosylase/AP lyase activity
MSFSIQELTERKTQEKFPSVVVLTPNETLPVVVRTLEKGDMQLIVEFNGKRKVVANISESAYNISKLLRTVGHISYRKSADEVIDVGDIVTYLNCI